MPFFGRMMVGDFFFEGGGGGGAWGLESQDA